MKVQVLSDLHIEFENFNIGTSGSDVLVLAGDIHVKDKGLTWALENVKEIPVLYVLGNHEFYGEVYPKLISKMKEKCKDTNVHILENDLFTWGDVNFLGCTLWTDFALLGDPRLAGFECQQRMTDYRKIRRLPSYSKIRSVDVSVIHRQSRDWIDKTLGELKGKKNVVISHHAPHIESLPVHRHNSLISSAYASDLRQIIERHSPSYWIHGHVHSSSNYVVGNCNILCNPKGYPDELNEEFYPEFSFNI